MQINRRKFIEVSGLTLVTAAMLKSQRRSRAGGLKVHDTKARALLSQMTLEEKVGQMIQANHKNLTDPSEIEKYFLGSVLSGGSSDPKTGNGLIDWTSLR